MSGLRRLAELLVPLRAETPFGGRSVTYESLGSVWLDIAVPGRRERTDGDVTRVMANATATARVDPRLAVGLILRLDGMDWSILGAAVDPKRPGRMILNLESAQ
ncbi:hypothetical protein BH10PSE2_BH10PSE2_02110 [soil metagenome]